MFEVGEVVGGAEFAFGQTFLLFAFEGHAVVGVEGHAAKDRVVGRGVAVAGLVVVLPIDGSISRSSGMAVISLLFSLTKVWARVMPASQAQALTACR